MKQELLTTDSQNEGYVEEESSIETLETPNLPVRAELPLTNRAEEFPTEPEYLDAEFHEVVDIETHLVEKGILSAEQVADTQTLLQTRQVIQLEKSLDVAQAELAKLEEIGQVLDISPEQYATTEKHLHVQEAKAKKMREQFLQIQGIEGETQLSSPVILEELAERLEAFELTLQREREKAVLHYITDSIEWALDYASFDLERSENAPQAQQLIIFTIYHGVLSGAQRFIREGGYPDYGFEFQYEMVEQPSLEGDNYYFTNIKLDMLTGGTYELPEREDRAEEGGYEEPQLALAA